MNESNSDFQLTPEIKIGAMLESGEQPIQRVFLECQDLKGGEIYELITPFLPAPLIESAKEKGYLVWAREEGEGKFKTYLTPN